jgi:hypothetical protein
MVGMLQIITWLLAFYLVLKGVEILQIALASPRENRSTILLIGWLALIGSVVVAFSIVALQEGQASSVGSSLPNY